jgi:hypothetical protein
MVDGEYYLQIAPTLEIMSSGNSAQYTLNVQVAPPVTADQ